MATVPESAVAHSVPESAVTGPMPENPHMAEMSRRFAARCAKGATALSRHITQELSVDDPTDADKVYRGLMALAEQQRQRAMSVFMNAVQFGV
ncbi:MAG: hypothetical protein PHX87_05815 [Candidatus Peribacteraceae bacterium]|nr:hypothetical protein [Candidatus Peribacteraceae bacterium]MDD5742908.1 hypothetical protein [Candidatus Peribacteraceae bacterium]